MCYKIIFISVVIFSCSSQYNAQTEREERFEKQLIYERTVFLKAWIPIITPMLEAENKSELHDTFEQLFSSIQGLRYIEIEGSTHLTFGKDRSGLKEWCQIPIYNRHYKKIGTLRAYGNSSCFAVNGN